MSRGHASASKDGTLLGSGVLSLPGSDLDLVRGLSGRDKTVLVRGVVPGEARRSLERHLG